MRASGLSLGLFHFEERSVTAQKKLGFTHHKPAGFLLSASLRALTSHFVPPADDALLSELTHTLEVLFPPHLPAVLSRKSLEGIPLLLDGRSGLGVLPLTSGGQHPPAGSWKTSAKAAGICFRSKCIAPGTPPDTVAPSQYL
ncbi:hypothetical protein STEG23_022593 [Scotinomys teguina]